MLGKRPYGEGSASSGNRPLAVGKRRLRLQSSSSSKARLPGGGICAPKSAGSEDELDGPNKVQTPNPGFVPPPTNRDLAKEQGELLHKSYII